MLTLLFPGQGSQKKGMGGTLFDEFSDLTDIADDVLGFSIKSLCLEDPEQKLNLTQYTQPALYVVNALTYFKKLKEAQFKADFVAGHSLGEYSALLAAEVFDFKTGLQLVKKRGELMSLAKEGGMAAVIGLKAKEINQILEKNNLHNITIANYNTHTQSVISGPKIDIEQTQVIFQKIKTVSYIPLKVSGAFHSSYMLSAQKEFADFLLNFEFAIPVIPVISNVEGQPYHPDIIKTNLANQISNPVLWTTILEYLFKYKNMHFEEVGPGNVLNGLLTRFKANQ